MIDRIIKNDNFKKVAAGVKPDVKKRIVLSKVHLTEGVTYHIYCNEIGQIILDPHISIPSSEIWVYNNPEAAKAIAEGLKQSSEGKVSEVDLKEL